MNTQDTDQPNDWPAPLDEGAASDGELASAPAPLVVTVGRAMPAAPPDRLPRLHATEAVAPAEASELSHARSMLADGVHFVGNVLLRGPCSVAGQVDGNITQAPGLQVSVVVTETGRVKGDITAHKISVMGHTDGVLDSGPGEVTIHDSASVHGLVRYGRIQVNGADLNATLERVAPAKPSH